MCFINRELKEIFIEKFWRAFHLIYSHWFLGNKNNDFEFKLLSFSSNNKKK